MPVATILSIIGAVTELTKGLADLYHTSQEVLSDTDADRVREAANKLSEENDRLAQVVLAKLG